MVKHHTIFYSRVIQSQGHLGTSKGTFFYLLFGGGVSFNIILIQELFRCLDIPVVIFSLIDLVLIAKN